MLWEACIQPDVFPQFGHLLGIFYVSRFLLIQAAPTLLLGMEGRWWGGGRRMAEKVGTPELEPHFYHLLALRSEKAL